ncbi:MAG: hypothetical protein H0X37_09920 [Herpetosiphonaceae bacterium]|nr:hypothetical protein [Herpetosiphonaceae bacterium]
MQTLDGPWKLAIDPLNHGRKEHWFTAVQAAALDARVPGVIQQLFPDYHGVAWYWTTFRAHRTASANERYLLRCGAVDYLADVWLNGVPVGGHEGGDTPFTLDLTAAIHPGGDNLLAVRVLNPTHEPIDGLALDETPHRNKTIRNYQPGRGYNYGGIIAPVEFVVVSAVRIIDLFLQPDVATGHIHITLTIRNDREVAVTGRLVATAEPASSGDLLASAMLDATFAPGDTTYTLTLAINSPRLWELHDPYLYRVTANLDARDANGDPFTHRHTARCGFRDFRVVDGFFRLNDRRIFLRSTHTGNHFPMGMDRAHELDFMRRDLVYAKASGFNMVRFICGMALAEQLDFCDELGLMVYEESQTSWLLADSPRLAEHFDRATREMVLRDRNHPSLTIWGLLNETRDGPVFRHAVATLPLVRSLDDTRLVLLSSGRWDAQPAIGSVANPGSAEWEHRWGSERLGAEPVSSTWDPLHPAYLDGAGDAHLYPQVPHTPETSAFIRAIGHDTKPVFLSEYGIGSLFNAIREYRMFEQHSSVSNPEATLIGSMAERLAADWERFGMDGVYAFPEDMLLASQRLHARQRLLGFDLIRSNPRFCGYNLTGMLDHAITGEGVWTFWREWKPQIVDTLTDGWAPLRWCLFCNPLHGYAGRTFTVEAVLANEDVLKPGDYPARLRIIGPQGVVWDKPSTVHIPQPAAGQDGPLAVPVLRADVSFSGPSGTYELAATLECGGAPAGGRLQFHVTDATTLLHLHQPVTLWGIEPHIAHWLEAQGVACQQFDAEAEAHHGVILVGEPEAQSANVDAWSTLARRIARGSAAVFLTPAAFRRGDDPVGWLPLANKGRCYAFNDWLYHKECVSKAHPIFAGLPSAGVMDWDYYGPVIPHALFDGQDTPDDVAAAAFAVGYSQPGGYASGILAGSYHFGAGRFFLNTLRILEHIDQHPAADRLLLNLISTASQATSASPILLPPDFDTWLANIGFL